MANFRHSTNSMSLKLLPVISSFIFFSWFSPTPAVAQQNTTPVLDAVTQSLKSQLDAMATEEKGILRVFCSRNNISGLFVFDITIQGKGDVLTVFMVSQNPEDISQKNLLKDKLHTLRFDNIKLAKNERVKFRHSLQF